MKVLTKLRLDIDKLKSSPELKKSLIYVMASAIGYGIVFIQNFSLAYILPISFFGKVSLIISLFSTLYVLFTFGLNAVVLRYYFDKEYKKDKKSLVSHVVVMWFLLGGCLLLVLGLLGYKLVHVDQYLQIDFVKEYLLIVLAAFLYSFSEIFPNLFIVEEKPLKYALFLILSKALMFGLLLVGIFLYGESSFHVSLMLLIVSLVMFLAMVIVFKVFPLTQIKKENVMELLRYAFPLMIYALGGIGYSHGYRVIISGSLNYNDLGLFSLSAQLASVYYLAVSSSITGLYPKAYKRLEESNGHPKMIRFYLRALIYIGLGTIVIILPLTYLFLMYFKNGAFLSSFTVLPVLIFGQFLFFIYAYSYILCTYYKKTNILTFSMFAGIITSLSLAFILIRESNILMAAIPVACGLLVQLIISLIATHTVARKNPQAC
ncbi:MAG: oligosaccharide flippase family protein [Sphingobacteriaceae bacterium]|nr:oligosaccharide flippase family protein [Sphingobacteriaceae bacterium]MBK7816794.1 oligosaccharide flippase family protein [Sphingobacteriaceae bacterium]